MQDNYNSKNSIQQVYGKIILLAFLAHIVFVCIFAGLAFKPLIIYNIFSVCFYAAVYRLPKLNHYRATVVLVHFEICFYVIVSTYYLGWNFGFPLYLIALASVVYFCPFKKKFVPYLFSLMEIIVFFTLKIYTLHNEPAYAGIDNYTSFFYLFNSAATFTLMVYAAFISKVSAVHTQQTLTENNTMLQDMVNHDTLTKLWTRTHLLTTYKELIVGHIPIIIVLCDIDNFKHINDTYGHDCGDIILSGIAGIMTSHCKDDITICRWGGEEFVIMLPFYKMPDGIKLIEQIREAIAATTFTYQRHNLNVTMTFGMSHTCESKDINELIRLADKRMYYGKRCGKNIVVTPEMKP